MIDSLIIYPLNRYYLQCYKLSKLPNFYIKPKKHKKICIKKNQTKNIVIVHLHFSVLLENIRKKPKK